MVCGTILNHSDLEFRIEEVLKLFFGQWHGLPPPRVAGTTRSLTNHLASCFSLKSLKMPNVVNLHNIQVHDSLCM